MTPDPNTPKVCAECGAPVHLAVGRGLVFSNTATIKEKDLDIGEMKTTQILESWLMSNGYDGLVDQRAECGCILSDFAPCGEIQPECEAGHTIKTKDERGAVMDCEECRSGTPCTFHIYPGKRPVTPEEK